MNIEDKQFVKAKIQGLSDTKAALKVRPHLNPKSASTTGHRLAHKPEIQQSLQAILKKHGITLDKAVAPIADALEANKLMVHGKNSDDSWVDVVPDHSIRLAASDRALKLLNTDKSLAPQDNLAALQQAIEDNTDEVELQRLIFKKDIPKSI